METKEGIPLNLYQSENFKDYVKDKFTFAEETVLENPAVLQTIYALEWYDIPRKNYLDLIKFHPYLTEEDDDALFYIRTSHQIENVVSFGLFSWAWNRILLKFGPPKI